MLRVQQRGVDSGIPEGFGRGTFLQSLIRGTSEVGAGLQYAVISPPFPATLELGMSVWLLALSPVRSVSTIFYHGAPCYHVWGYTIVLP